MAILFVGGVMNVLWIVAVTIFVSVEKMVPVGRVISRVTGVGFFAGGVWMLAQHSRRPATKSAVGQKADVTALNLDVRLCQTRSLR